MRPPPRSNRSGFVSRNRTCPSGIDPAPSHPVDGAPPTPCRNESVNAPRTNKSEIHPRERSAPPTANCASRKKSHLPLQAPEARGLAPLPSRQRKSLQPTRSRWQAPLVPGFPQSADRSHSRDQPASVLVLRYTQKPIPWRLLGGDALASRALSPSA